jgi:hypothetical protein
MTPRDWLVLLPATPRPTVPGPLRISVPRTVRSSSFEANRSLRGSAEGQTFLAAAEICESFGEASEATEYRRRFENVMRTLAQNFDPEDRLRSSLLAALETGSAVMGLCNARTISES